MSYINDALRKAQQEKDGRYSRYSGIISALPGPRSHRRRKWIIAAVSMMLMLAALFVWLATTGHQERSVAARQQAPEKAVTAGQAQLPATPATVVPAAPVARATEAESSTTAIKVDSATPAARTAIVEPAPTVARTEPVGSAAPAKGTAQAESAAKATGVRTAAPAAPPAAVTSPLPEVGTLYREALAAQRNKKLEVAERLYRRILTLDAQHVEAMNNLGVLYMGQGRQEQAVALFSKAIAAKKDYIDPYYNLACLYAQRKDASKSLAYLKSAIAIDRAVIDWVKTDMDMKDIRDLEAFKKLMVKEEK
jgi:tetratricopeptide (TPR) repeat protein